MTFWITLLFFALAGYVTLRMKPATPLAGVLRVLGYVLTFIVIVSLLRSALPRYFVRSQPAFAANWAPVWNEAAGSTNIAVNAANEWLDLGVPAVPEVEMTAVEAAEPVITELQLPATANSEATTAVPVPQPTVVPTSAPDPETQKKLALYSRLSLAQASNDRAVTQTVIETLLQLDALDPVATDAQLLIQAADLRLSRYAELSALPLTIRKDSARQELVLHTLHGGRYRVVESGAWFANFACQEKSTLVDETAGFTKGARFTVPRCYLEPLEATTTGARINLEQRGN